MLLGFAMKFHKKGIHFTAKLAQNGCGLKTFGCTSTNFVHTSCTIFFLAPLLKNILRHCIEDQKYG